ncbi:hypothetical protein, conserved [Eimeria praecox]|uniref:Uncharacterized protein n=1 Tax=Eimeria praecox TaxID=51316 RepID=U6GKR8_9EIME|nr:hypothetical protein, conserved [Eimeria praecox]
MEALFNFLLQEDEPGESFDPRAARPRCKVCGADAWLQWDGRYADYCSRSCRDKQAGSQGLVPAPGPLKPSQRREGGPGGRPNMLGERQAQLLQEKEDKWERQFSPRNRYLPRKKAQTQEQDPGQQQQRAEGRGSAAAAAARALAEAAAAKKVARALRQRIPPKVAPRRPSGPRMEGGPPSVASTPRKMLSIISRGSDENLPLQRQRTVARFVEQGENAAELQTALKEYQENLNRERQKLEEERTAAVVADEGNVRRLATAATTAADGDAGRLRRSATAATAAAAAAKATTEQQRRETEASVELLQRERAKYEEQMRAIREESEQQLQQHKAQLVSEVKRIAAEELDAQKALEKELGEVRASLQQLKKQQEQQRQQQQLLLQNELEQHLRAQLQQDLEQQLERKLRDKLQEELRQELQQELQRKQEQLEGRDGVGRVEGRRSKEHLLRQELLEQQVHQEKRLQQQLLEQQRQQEKLLYQLRQQEQTLQRLAAAAGPGSSASRPQRPSSRGGEITADQQLRDLLLQGLFSCLKMHDSQQQQHKQKQQQQQQPETLEASSWAERELALRDAKAAEAAAAAEAKGNHIIGPYEGRLEAAVVEANLQLPDPMEQQHGLRFGSKLQVVFRVATGPGEWEEKETSFSADGQWGETLSFSVHWPSAGVAAASAVLYAQLWATMNSNTTSTGPCSSSCRYFVGEAALPLPTFTSLWEYRAPLRWRSSLGGNTQQQLLLQQGNLLLRVQFYPAEKAQAPVASTEKPEDLQALLPTSDVTTELPSNPNNCRGSTKGGASSHCSGSTDSRTSSRNSSGIGNHSEKQLQPEKLLRDISEGDSTLQQQLLQQLEELSLAWRRALSEQELQQKQPQNRIPVVIDSQLLQEHLQRSPMMGALTNKNCNKNSPRSASPLSLIVNFFRSTFNGPP